MSDRIHLTADQEKLQYLFCEQTDCDLAVAHLLLDENDWQFNTAMDIYQHMIASQNSIPAAPNPAVPSAISPDSGIGATNDDDEVTCLDPCSIKIKVLTWNIDGLCENLLKPRMKAILCQLSSLKCAAVLLQEVIDPIFHSLYDVFSEKYHIYRPDNTEFPYFCTMLIDKNLVSNVQFSTKEFASSQMGRSLLCCEGDIFGVPIRFFTTHLESMRNHSATRISQLQQCFQHIKQQSSFAIFGGDLNLRDNELKSIDMNSFQDSWVVSGSPTESRYTWDLYLNDNCDLATKNNRIRLRFDRLYLYNHDQSDFVLKNFELVGTKRLSFGVFPSDHFGIQLDLEMMLK